MIQLDNQTLRQIQLIQLEMLAEVNRICEKCGIKYVIIAGTLLGAVRHGGYIPWDDDADVAMMREEYEKFRKACETELDHSRFVFQDHKNTPGYRWGYAKLRRKDTIFLREHQEHMPYMQGIFIDIFPLDNVPNNYALRCIHNFECFCVRKLLWSEVGKYAHPMPLMRKWYALLSKIPVKIPFAMLDGISKQNSKKKTTMVRILMFPTANKTYGYERKWYEERTLIKFEGMELQAPKEYQEYLSFKFGNYMELPPPEKRKVHPVTQIRLLSKNN